MCVAWVVTVQIIWVSFAMVYYWICILPEFILNLELHVRLCILVFLQNRHPKDTPRNPLEKTGWRLAFSDDFDTGQLDVNKWEAQSTNGDPWDNNPRDTNNKMQVYFSLTNFAFTSTTIKIIADNIPQQLQAPDPMTGLTYAVPYKVGLLKWKVPLEQQQGYFEIRCKVPNTIEMWPAFWLSGVGVWPPEIDVFEFYTNDTNSFESTQHWGQEPNHPKQTKTHSVSRAADYFHIYSCEWGTNSIKWYYDNQLIRVASSGISDFIYPMFVIVNTMVDTRQGHQPAQATFPNYFEVDYVRAYA